MSYITDLMLHLAAGAGNLPDTLRQRHATYLVGAQNEDGGFAGRRGNSDPYYTSFALRGLAMLGVLTDETAGRTARFLQQRLGQPLPAVDFVSLVVGSLLLEAAAGIDVFAECGRDRRQTVCDYLGRFRLSDGGYAKTQRSGQSSTYHTFLAVWCQQAVGASLENPEPLIELVRSRRRDDGGFAEIGPVRQGGTNPTAAAVGLLQLLDRLDDDTRTGAARFLAQMQTAQGGLRANARVPVPDLLSTFTGLVALRAVEEIGGGLSQFSSDERGLSQFSSDENGTVPFPRATVVDSSALRRFTDSLDQPAGGFRAGAWDDAVDVEYTFYGLGVLALLPAGEG